MMWNSISHFFNNIRLTQSDNIKTCERNYNYGRIFSIIRYGINRDTYELNKIYMTPWKMPVVCVRIILTKDINDANASNIYLGKDRLPLYNKYGPYDYIEFSPIYSSVFFNKIKNNNSIELTEPGIIHFKEFFLYKTYLDRMNKTLISTDYFDNKSIESLLFIPVSIDSKFLKLAYIIDMTDIQFILASTSYINLVTSHGNVNKDFSKFSHVDTYSKLKSLLISSRVNI